MQTLVIRNIACHAHHGCLPEETRIGSAFSVSLEFRGDFTAAMESDDLQAAVDYVRVHQLVREEMAIPSRLIEHVAQRLLQRMKSAFPQVHEIVVHISKFNPPVNGQIEAAVFTASL